MGPRWPARERKGGAIRGRPPSAGADSRAAWLSRRSAVLGVAGVGLVSIARTTGDPRAPAPAAARRPAESLGAAAAKAGILFGASIGQAAFDDPAYRKLYLDNARVLTTDLALKFGVLRPDRGAPRYAAADAILAFAEANRMAARGHNLIWNENNPDWVKSLSATEIGALLDRHVEETVGRYAGRVHSWDVVNEPFWPDHHAPGFFRRGPWFDALGPAYIARALRRAAAADPKARLVINEAFTERGDGLAKTVRRELLRLIDDLRHAGAPLHAIGLEAHLQPQYGADDTGFLVFLDEIARRDLDIYITELDIDDVDLPDDIAERDEMAADRVFTFLSRALTCPAVKIVECWQLSDRYSWYADPALAGRRQGASRPLPFDADMKPKPMFDAIARAFASRDA